MVLCSYKNIALFCSLMKLAFSLIFSVFCFQYSFAQKEVNVLFIGNSLTFNDSRYDPNFPYYNNMTEMLQKMMDERKLKVHIEKVTHGGASLANHATYIGSDGEMDQYRRVNKNEVPSAVKKIANGHWDMVVLQEAGGESVLNPGLRYFSTDPALRFLDSVIKKAHARTVLFQGYAGLHPVDTDVQLSDHAMSTANCIVLDAFGFGFKSIVFFYPEQEHQMEGKDTAFCPDHFKDSEEEFRAIGAEYDRLAAKIGADVVQIGQAFEKCKKDCREIPLYYRGDDGHPSTQAAYLIACMFFKYITGQNVDKMKYHGDITEAEAQKLQKVADSIQPRHNSPSGQITTKN